MSSFLSLASYFPTQVTLNQNKTLHNTLQTLYQMKMELHAYLAFLVCYTFHSHLLTYSTIPCTGAESGQLLMKITFYFWISASYLAQLLNNLILKRRLQNQPLTNNISKQLLQNVMAMLHAFCKAGSQTSFMSGTLSICSTYNHRSNVSTSGIGLKY